jgi:hypothetical protein
MRIGRVMMLAALVGVSACGGADTNAGPTPTATGSETPRCDPEGTALKLAAEYQQFDKRCLAAPAGQAFTVELDNKEALPHDFAIFQDLRSTTPLFDGEEFTGPAVKTFNVPPLAAGDFTFKCIVHPTRMIGDLRIR